jgi:hypothetical protein
MENIIRTWKISFCKEKENLKWYFLENKKKSSNNFLKYESNEANIRRI